MELSRRCDPCDELYGYVHDRVVEEMPQQRPKKQDNVEGRTVIART
ncbi:hypothetical protein [Nonomuraea gerenzanensis]|uniref:Uncharacterized protein n=1 Tax=Nonomuraea gerenzanensis TaxID=93944 RepID=A0A1M4EEE6_9ACTN|nr:hypothetical protein [Nonomuraea gerenzanensis]UBU08909.1 hypothetical protein LCN96_31550 [Nonomuraea gerenzanensis]SBO97285.1 hypothetical protein BN4615_P6801 [Nonomuraea gerenzanensis]